MSDKNLYQWFIITAIGGKEDSIVESLKEKINNFGYNDYVKEFKIFKTTLSSEEILAKDDERLPKNLRNTKTIKWEVLPDGSYKRIRNKVVNKFPGYVFINMIMDKDVWYCIRNTNGVMGFVGSSGKGALPIPISIEEYEVVANENTTVENKKPEAETTLAAVKEEKTYTCNFKEGNTVEIIDGPMSGEKGTVKFIDLKKGTATIEVEIFGRTTNSDVEFSKLKLAD